MALSPEVTETGSVESSSPSSITIASRAHKDFDRVSHPKKSQYATEYFLHSPVGERFFQAPIDVPRKTHTKWQTLAFAFRTLGIVYGDLGTSPLYVYPSIISAETPNEDDYLGILSCIFWTLTLIGVIKYTLIVLWADDHGEGGTFAMYSLICQHTDVGGQTRKIILSAIGGIRAEVPSISQNVVVWVSAVVLVVLFCCQSYGTNKVAFLFSPIMATWLLTTPMVGMYNIIIHYPTVFKAFSPAFIYRFFQKNGKQGWHMLGGIVLCITGCEAMFADLGHFNRLSIQLAFSFLVYPSVLLTYAGQTAYLINHPENYLEGFFKMVPEPVFWPMFVVATLAAIVASQGLITATFSVIKQSVALDYFPPVKIVHTSEYSEGQVYSPEVNYGLMVLCLAVVFGFRSATTIGNAFGVAVVCVMIITTCLMAIVMLVIWNTNWLFVSVFFTVFIFVEGCYFSVVITKIPQGGWLPFIISILFTLIMTSWNYGRRKKFEYEMKNKLSKKTLGELLSRIGDHRVPGVCFFYTDIFHGIPPIVKHYVQNVRTLHQVIIFTTVRHIPIKTVLAAERFLVGRIGFTGVYHCVARYGYMDLLSSETTYFLDQVTQCLTKHIGSALDFSDNPDEVGQEDERAREIQMIVNAKAAGAVYVLGRSEFKVDNNTSYLDRIVAGIFYPFLNSICRSPVSSLHIPPANFLELGMYYDLL
ncbi:probable potassium transporter 17 isoform X3 [Physcomitrium patens]|uniref:probable potassium transporter 17 isoform X3 n=1 Tax=Physcomitrium patens TaxID=3218 RepID=UPI000D174A80|nr:probable potassium transporter 17 isoform X3 [Physcomitrium patens]|eukprot:XP_024357815.1 probable potassium transporter 17 isoform X3 [Physcomitrella patens]